MRTCRCNQLPGRALFPDLYSWLERFATAFFKARLVEQSIKKLKINEKLYRKIYIQIIIKAVTLCSSILYCSSSSSRLLSFSSWRLLDFSSPSESKYIHFVRKYNKFVRNYLRPAIKWFNSVVLIILFLIITTFLN